MKRELEALIKAAVNNLFGIDIASELIRPEEQFGDYATNVALQLAGQLDRKPREIAEELTARLRTDLAGQISNITIAGPGFLNLRLTDASLLKSLQPRTNQTLDGKTVVVEYSDPNAFKPLHAGHLYTTLVGDAIARLIEHAGAKTVRLNYSGDVGLHVAKSMWSIIKTLGREDPDRLQEIPLADRPAWLGARYVEGNDAYEDEPVAKDEITEINRRIYQLHADDDHQSTFAQLYWTGRQWSYDYFKTLYEQLGVVAFDRLIPESEVTALGLATVKEQCQKGVYRESAGAIIFPGEDYGLHTRVFINSAGLPTYEAKDVGLILTKWRDYHFDQSIVITASEQQEYMAVMLRSVEQFAPEPAHRTRHLTHGVVKLAGGIKMSSRHGNIVNALDIIESATSAAHRLADNTSENTVMAAIKYAFLKNRIGGDSIYDPQESVSLEGNSGPYLQYAHARARSILRKAKSTQFETPVELEPAERRLGHKISEYSEIVDRAVAELMPHHICTYLYELAQNFNSFYEHNRVIGDERQSSRLYLVKHYADTLKEGLELLGITAPDHL